MKKIIIALILCLGLVACSSEKKEEAKETKEEQTTQENEPEVSQNIIVKTDFFQIELPQNWEGKYQEDIIEAEDGAYSLCLSEKESRKAIDGGHLMSIGLYINEEEYIDLPSYEYIGKLVGDKTYNVVIVYPTDVQFDDSSADNYRELVKDLDDIIKTINGINGYTFEKEN